jgi:hypothetical protein
MNDEYVHVRLAATARDCLPMLFPHLVSTMFTAQRWRTLRHACRWSRRMSTSDPARWMPKRRLISSYKLGAA